MTDGRPAPAARARRLRPLLGVFPLAVMTLATFLVVFTLLMARLTAGVDPALQGRPAAATLTAAGGRTLTTRASGAAAGAGAQQVSAQGASTTAPAIVTRTSGGAGAGRFSDD